MSLLSFARILLAAGLSLAMATGAALAEGSAPNADASVEADPGAVAYLDAALALADFGRAEGAPLVLLAAAEAIERIGTHEGQGPVTPGALPEDARPPRIVAGADLPSLPVNLAAALLDEARFLARGDATILARAEALEALSGRGSMAGPGQYRIEVGARASVVIDETFRGRSGAEVSLAGSGGSDLDLLVEDENGNRICLSESPRDRELCRWVPVWDGAFRITVLNLGERPAAALVTVN